jgi:hypothetical protein
MSTNIDILLENQTLKSEFAIRDLDLSQVFELTPEDLERENSVLSDLLEWVQRYTECKNRKIMEAEGYEFPPIEPAISPDEDWYHFECWMQGRPLRKKLKDQIYPKYNPKNPEELTDKEICTEWQKLIDLLSEIHITVEFQEEVPIRLKYMYLLKSLDEEYEIINTGFWHLDGCSGYCPDCFQRPWCEYGCQSYWTEDEKEGKMFLINSVKQYVSASPVSLKILKQFQDE